MDYIGEDMEDMRTIFCGNLHTKVTEEILYELFLQVGPLEKVSIPNDRHGRPQAYGFVTFKHTCSVPYALNLLQNISLYNTKLNLRPRTNCDNYSSPTVLLQMGTQMNFNSNVDGEYGQVQFSSNANMAPAYNNTPIRGHNDYYRNESLQGRWLNYSQRRDRDLRPNENHRYSHKRHRR